MRYFILYGCQNKSLLEAKNEVELSLDVAMEERESEYQGGVYYSHKYEGEEVAVLKVNFDLFDEEPAEQGFPEFPVLLYLSYVRDPLLLEGLLSSQFKLLRQNHQ